MPRPDVPDETALFLFALTDTGLFALTESGAVDVIAAAGEDGPFPQPTLHRAGPIAAIVSRVALADYRGTEAAQSLADLAWIGPRAMQHAAILSWAMRHSPVFPVPFGTLYTDPDSLSAFMLAHQERLARFFALVAGMAEWELTANVDLGRRETLDRVAQETCPGWAGLAPGARYLRLCRERPRLAAMARERAARTAPEFAARFRPPAAATRLIVRPPAPIRAANDGAEPVARFALLAPLDGGPALARRAGELAEAAADGGISLGLSGPWPPFSFRPDLPAPGS